MKLERANFMKAKFNSIKRRDEAELYDEECGVCLADLFGEGVRGDVSQIKQCGHAFHTHCIMEWF